MSTGPKRVRLIQGHDSVRELVQDGKVVGKLLGDMNHVFVELFGSMSHLVASGIKRMAKVHDREVPCAHKSALGNDPITRLGGPPEL